MNLCSATFHSFRPTVQRRRWAESVLVLPAFDMAKNESTNMPQYQSSRSSASFRNETSDFWLCFACSLCVCVRYGNEAVHRARAWLGEQQQRKGGRGVSATMLSTAATTHAVGGIRWGSWACVVVGVATGSGATMEIERQQCVWVSSAAAATATATAAAALILFEVSA